MRTDEEEFDAVTRHCTKEFQIPLRMNIEVEGRTNIRLLIKPGRVTFRGKGALPEAGSLHVEEEAMQVVFNKRPYEGPACHVAWYLVERNIFNKNGQIKLKKPHRQPHQGYYPPFCLREELRTLEAIRLI
jgi:hypothetical protein